ncbi:hypothetical protein GCG54_00005736 [Colletotrichum gloeosporioides]|uniref:Amidoligase enzyme n=1 Tax=Colletotrichum gloeosporioides TaxID=474922 RepID=A0A8H4CJL3_COLGL|nr:uncharacterized protein GCG54_00005736 [Colletotrichum gloeosporioides]KAF3804991.1 hypothetical protein GCG54_00005736 [Colletotrichum gloeosporioides]
MSDYSPDQHDTSTSTLALSDHTSSSIYSDSDIDTANMPGPANNPNQGSRFTNPSAFPLEIPGMSPLTSPVLAEISPINAEDEIYEHDLNGMDKDARDMIMVDAGRKYAIPESSDPTEPPVLATVWDTISRDQQPGPDREVLFSAELEFWVQVSGEEGKALTCPPRNFVKRADIPPDECLERFHLQHRICRYIRDEANFFSVSESADQKTTALWEEYKQEVRNGSHAYNASGHWDVMVEPKKQLPEENDKEWERYNKDWMLVRVSSPLMRFSEENIKFFDAITIALKDMPGLTIGLDHKPRLRVSLKPLTGFTLPDLKKLLTFLWSVSPLIDTLHAKSCGPGSLIAPGLEFSEVFNCLPHTCLSDAEWRAPREQTIFTHGPPIKTTTKMLQTPDVMRNSSFSKYALLEIATAEDIQSLISMTDIPIQHEDGQVYNHPGAYDFSGLLESKRGDQRVQFAQHAGTMHFDAISNWIKVCHGLVSFAINAPRDRIEHILSLNSPVQGTLNTYDVLELLTDIDLSAQAEYYRNFNPRRFPPDLAARQPCPTIDLEEHSWLSPYTFGVELEFLLPYALEVPDRHDSRWTYVLPSDTEPAFISSTIYEHTAEHLASLLNSKGHFSATYNTVKQCRLDPPHAHYAAHLATVSAVRGHTVDIIPGASHMYQLWHVSQDSSLTKHLGPILGYSGGVSGFEISSPIFRDRASDCRQILEVLAILRAETRPMLDGTCGTHVHVGSVRPFTLTALKKLACLAWVVDPILSTLVHPVRGAVHHAAPLRTGSNLAENTSMRSYEDLVIGGDDKMLVVEIDSHLPMRGLPRRLQDEFTCIWGANDHNRLTGLLAAANGTMPPRGSISFDKINCMSGSAFPYGPWEPVLVGTVEFRALEGTLDPVLVAHWARLAVAIVQTAVEAEPAEFFKIMTRLLKERRNSRERLKCFLEVVGMGHTYSYWKEVAEKNKPLAALVEQWNPKNRWVGDEPNLAWIERNVVALSKLPRDAAEELEKAFKR